MTRYLMIQERGSANVRREWEVTLDGTPSIGQKLEMPDGTLVDIEAEVQPSPRDIRSDLAGVFTCVLVEPS